jgi:galactokinase
MPASGRLCASAPGRICLFGEHQDFLGLPVIAAAVDRRIRIDGTRRGDRQFVVQMPDIDDEDRFEVEGDLPYRQARDYLRSTVNVLRREGMRFEAGYDCVMTSTIPINAGTSSSSAMIVAWTRFLLATQPHDIASDPESIARLAHRAEVLEFNEPGGMMDHFAAAYGGLIFVDTVPPFRAERLPAQLDGFVLADSLQRKKTLEVLRKSKEDVLAGVGVLKENVPDFSLATVAHEEAARWYPRMTPDSARKIAANLANRDLCQQAKAMLAGGQVDPPALGRMLTEHHRHLSEGLQISTPLIDGMLQAALAAGALGGKLNGSGGGGCFFAYAPDNREEVRRACEQAGAEAWQVQIDEGARVKGEG